jgi:hypothetical protein
MPAVAVPSDELQGFAKFLKDARLNFFEFALLVGFWLLMGVAASYVSVETVLGACWPAVMAHTCTRTHHIGVPRAAPLHSQKVVDNGRVLCALRARTGFPPIALFISGVSTIAEYIPVVSAVGGLLLLAYGLFKFRADFSKLLLLMVRKLTRSKR